MTLRMSVGLAALAVCLAANAARADTKTLAESGAWTAFGGTTNSGRSVCGVSSEGGGRYFGLKFFAGEETFTIQMGNKAWKVKNASKHPLTMQFDAHTLWKAVGTGMHFNDGDAGLEYDIAKKELATFMSEFGTSRKLVLRFKSKGFPTWTLDIADAKSVIKEFENCNSTLRKT